MPRGTYSGLTSWGNNHKKQHSKSADDEDNDVRDG